MILNWEHCAEATVTQRYSITPFGPAQLGPWAGSHIHPPLRTRRPRRAIEPAYPYGTNVQDRLSWPRPYSQLPVLSVMLLQSHAQPVRAPEPYVRETARVGSKYHL
jgi:hypothetical protein